jgi:hypothetical protein
MTYPIDILKLRITALGNINLFNLDLILLLFIFINTSLN